MKHVMMNLGEKMTEEEVYSMVEVTMRNSIERDDLNFKSEHCQP